jgi:CHAD domain-containing protein
LKKRKTAIDFLLRKPSEKYTANTFHKLRVEIKKLNSLFDLIHFCSINFKRKATYKPFKSIFRQAGKVRELQIEDTMLTDHFGKKIVKNRRINLKRLRLKEEKYFFSMLNKKLKNQVNKKYQAIIPHLNKIDKKKKITYFDKKKNYIQELLVQESIQIEQIHKLRKQLKILNYNKAIVDKEKPEEKFSKQNVLPELLGKWHDCQVIIKHLEKTLKRGQLSVTELDQIKSIKSKIVQESNVQLNEIRNTLPESRLFGGHN